MFTAMSSTISWLEVVRQIAYLSRMKTACSLLLTASLAFLFTACEKADPESPSAEAAPAVGVLKTISYEITLHSTADGPLYSVRDKEGKELATEVSKEDLAANYPEIHEELKSLWAGNDAAPVKAENLLPASALDGLKEAFKP